MTTIDGQHGRAQLKTEGGIATLNLTHPDKLNCLSPEMLEDLSEFVWTLSEQKDELDAILLTAEGRAFCGGADIEYLSDDRQGVLPKRWQLELQYVRYWLRNVPIPVIAAARGPAVGGGASLLCFASDLQVVASDIEIWWPEIGHGSINRRRCIELTSIVGPARATEILLFGEVKKLQAEEAHQLGLVSHVADDQNIESRATDIAELLSSHDSDLVTEYLEAIYQSREGRYPPIP